MSSTFAQRIDTARPFRLVPEFKDRVWGFPSLRDWFPDAPDGKVIGEAWFTAEENRTESGLPLSEVLARKPQVLGSGCNASFPELCPLLVKFLFTSSRLS